MKNFILLSGLFFLLSSCTSIEQPIASRPLVEKQDVSSKIPISSSSLSSALSNKKVGDVLVIGQQRVVMGNQFFAATGLTCRKLTTEVSGQNTYCLDIQGHWFKVNRVISEYSEGATLGVNL